jgi:hypothetical protein
MVAGVAGLRIVSLAGVWLGDDPRKPSLHDEEMLSEEHNRIIGRLRGHCARAPNLPKGLRLANLELQLRDVIMICG